MKGGELAEYTASAEFCMTLPNVHRRVALASFFSVDLCEAPDGSGRLENAASLLMARWLLPFNPSLP
jgi:hypothetical protein